MGEPGNRETGRASSNGMTFSGSMEEWFALEVAAAGMPAGPVVKSKIRSSDKPYLATEPDFPYRSAIASADAHASSRAYPMAEMVWKIAVIIR
ncbi:MAG: hypothetical protein ACO3JG_04305 [Luteolibacter sp.]